MAGRVMIIWASAGGGHRCLMQALTAALADLDPDVEVVSMDIYSKEWATFPFTIFPRIYAVTATSYPLIWRGIYYATDNPRTFTFMERLVQPILREGLRRAVIEYAPDVAVCVYLGIGPTLQQVLGELDLSIPIAYVVADLVSLHTGWMFHEAAWFAVPSEEAQQRLAAGGISPERVHVTGLPLREIFWDEPANRIELRQRLGLPPEAPVVMVVAGAEGYGDLGPIADQLFGSGLSCHVVVIAGTNQALRDNLTQRTSGQPCTVLGYVTNMAEWMWASDVLVTKAGPTTIAEAIRCRLPMVLTGAVPGQEEGNVAYVLDRGVGLLATTPTEIAGAVTRILSDSALTESITRAMHHSQCSNAAHAVAQMILETVRGDRSPARLRVG